MNERKQVALSILSGFCANPSVFAPNSRFGWGLVNCSSKQLCDYALELADELERAAIAKATGEQA